MASGTIVVLVQYSSANLAGSTMHGDCCGADAATSRAIRNASPDAPTAVLIIGTGVSPFLRIRHPAATSATGASTTPKRSRVAITGCNHGVAAADRAIAW